MYTKQNMKELRNIARVHGVKNINSYRRDDLVDILMKIDEGILPTNIRTADSNVMHIELDESLTFYKEVTDEELKTVQIKDSLLLEKVIREIIADNPDCDLDILKLEKSLKELSFEKVISGENDDLPDELTQLNSSINVANVTENKIDSKFDKINMYETRILELESQLKRVEKDLAKQKIQPATTDKSRGESFSKSSDSTPDEYEFKLTIKNLEKKNNELVELLNSFQNEYFNAKKQIDVLESRLSERDEELNYDKNVTEIRHMDFESNKFEKLKLELEVKNKAVILLNNKVEKLNNDIKLLESNSKNNKELLQLNADLNLEKQDLVKKRVKYIIEKNELEKENVHLKSKLNDLDVTSDEVDSLKYKLNSANKEINDLNEKIIVFEQNKKNLERLEYNYKYLQEKYLKSSEENEKLKDMLSEVRRELDELKFSKDDSQNEMLYKNAKTELKSLTDKYNQVYSEKIKLSTEISNLKGEIYNLRTLNKDEKPNYIIKYQREEIDKELERLKIENTRLVAKEQSYLIKNASKMDIEYEKLYENSKFELDTLKTKCDKIHIEKLKLMRENSNLKREVFKFNQVNNFEQSVTSLKQIIEEKDELIDQYKRNESDYKVEIEVLVENLNRAENIQTSEIKKIADQSINKFENQKMNDFIDTLSIEYAHEFDELELLAVQLLFEKKWKYDELKKELLLKKEFIDSFINKVNCSFEVDVDVELIVENNGYYMINPELL